MWLALVTHYISIERHCSILMGRMNISHFYCLGANKLWAQMKKHTQQHKKTKTKKTSSALKEFKFSFTPRLLTDSHGARGLAPAWSKYQVMPKRLLDIGFSLTLDLP